MVDSKYMYIGIEVSTLCNAQCPWCFATKKVTPAKIKQGRGLMTFKTFKSVIERLEALGFLQKGALINLYAIGEPFLNKDLKRMLCYLNEKSLRYAISTNASVPLLFKEGSGALKNLSNLIISVPGFSQESYDRIHGFSFEKIKKNIVKLINNYRRSGFKGDARLVYHVYQFNLDEIYKAREFAQEHKLDFYPYFAILYEYQHVRDFLKGTLAYDLLKKASQEIFLANIEKTISARAPNYKCGFFDMLMIDADADLKTCCQIKKGDPGYSYGNLFDLSAREIIAKRTTQTVCKKCQALGMDYYLSVYTPFNLYPGNKGESKQMYKNLLKYLRKNAGKEIVLFGAGRVGMKALACLKKENFKVRFFSDNSSLKIGRKISGVQVIAPTQISKRCQKPLVIITTINYRQVMDQLSQLGIKPVRYFPVEAYSVSSQTFF